MDTHIADFTTRLPARRKPSTGWVGIMLIALVAGFCMLSGAMILSMRQQVWVHTTQTSQNLLEAETGGIERILTMYDATLRSASDALRNPLLRRATPELRRMAIFGSAEGTPALEPVRIVDAEGIVLYDQAASNPSGATPAEERAVALHRLSAGSGPILSAPFRTQAGTWAITMSRRIPAEDGGFPGVVAGTIDLALFEEQFQRLNVGSHDVVTLFSEDGVVLAHIPGDPSVGRSIAGSDVFKQFRSAQAGTFAAPAVFDGVRRIFSFRHIAPWPLFVDVGLSTQDLYRRWYYRSALTVSMMAALVASTLFLLRLLRRDLQARQMAEKNLQVSEHQYRLLAESAADVICRVDRHTIRTYVSPSCAQYGYEPDDLVGMTSSSWIHEDDLVATREVFLRTIDEQVDGVVRYRLRTKSGQYTWVESYLSPIRQGGYLGIIRNINAETRGEPAQTVGDMDPEQQASADALTGLANRRAFEETLASAWQDAATARRPLSLILVDVDRFRSYNDQYGEQAGDAALAEIARLIDIDAREFGGFTARYRHNEFAVMLPRADLNAALRVSHAIRSCVWDAALPHAGGPAGRVTVSVGAATVVPNMVAGTPDALVRAASDALGRAKQSGRNEVQAVAMA